jgi:hypothetical protein
MIGSMKWSLKTYFTPGVEAARRNLSRRSQSSRKTPKPQRQTRSSCRLVGYEHRAGDRSRQQAG